MLNSYVIKSFKMQKNLCLKNETSLFLLYLFLLLKSPWKFGNTFHQNFLININFVSLPFPADYFIVATLGVVLFQIVVLELF